MVRTAILARRPFVAVYDGKERFLSPHVLGTNKKGWPRVLCYQYGGWSNSGLAAAGSPENWRCIAIEKLRDIRLLDDSWQTAPNHSRQQNCIEHVDLDVENLP